MRINAEYTSLAFSYQKQQLSVKTQEKDGEQYKDTSMEMEMVSLQYEKMTYSLSSLNAGKKDGTSVLPYADTTGAAESNSLSWNGMMDSIENQISEFIEKLEELIGMQVEESYDKKLEQMRAEASKSIEDGEEWGADTVSGRILDFAKSISGNDTSKIELLKKAVDEGFSFVREKLGGELPDVSQRTYELVMKGFEEWATEKSLSEQDEIKETE